MSETAIFSLITQGGPAAMAALCFFLYLREANKRDAAIGKVEDLTERCIEALVKVDNALEANVSSAQSINQSIQSILGALSMIQRGDR